MSPPVAKRLPVQQTNHGVTRVDEYGWLRATNWQDCAEDPTQLPADIKAYLDAENAWYEDAMADTQVLQSTLIAEMRGRVQANDESLPDTEGLWCYQERYRGDEEYPSYWRYPRDMSDGIDANDKSTTNARSALSGTEQLLVDFNVEAGNHAYFELGDVEYSPAHTHLLWSADTSGSERYTVTVRNLLTGKDEDVISDVESVVWGNEKFLFYTQLDAKHRPSKVLRHELGTDPSNDQVVFEETDPRFFCSVWVSLSKACLFVSSDTDDQNEVWFLSTADICAELKLIEPRTEHLEYSVEHQNARFLILTNADDAVDFKIMEVPCHAPERENWIDWLPHQLGRMVLEVYTYRDWVMWLEREHALPRLCYCRVGNNDIQRIEFTEEAYALSLEPLLEFDEQCFRFGYESPSTPEQTYQYDMQSGLRVLLKEDVVPSGHNAKDYIVRRRYAQSADGEQVPVTILYHVNTPINGTAPCWLTGYGAYGLSTPAAFSTTCLSLVNRGFVYVIAHVRGGQEKGRAWYEAARFGGKPKSVDDLLAVGEYLVEQRYSNQGGIVLSGGSAGGLLVAAALNRPSDLWGGAIVDVPFVDALNTMLDDSLPLTPAEWSQWGNPIDSEQAFHDIRGYSPYDNIQARVYPPMLVTAGVSDPRVTYWEPAKWVARHRHLRSDDNLLLLKTNMHSGHFGQTGRYASLADYAVEQAFALMVMGCDNTTRDL